MPQVFAMNELNCRNQWLEEKSGDYLTLFESSRLFCETLELNDTSKEYSLWSISTLSYGSIKFGQREVSAWSLVSSAVTALIRLLVQTHLVLLQSAHGVNCFKD